jgi:hypothetical protein
MMMLTSLGSMPQTLPLAVPSDLIGFMLVLLAISALAVGGSVLGRLWGQDQRDQQGRHVRPAGPILTPPHHAMPA